MLSCIILALNMSNQVGAASFNCTEKKLTTIEKMICSDSHLSKLDSELASAYNKARKEMSTGDRIKADQINWLKTIRNKCHDIECLSSAYINRVQGIQHSLPMALATDDLGYICKNTSIQKIKLFKYIANNDTDSVESALSSEGEICNVINNMEVQTKDLNRDGRPELLVYPGFGCGAQNCQMFVFQDIQDAENQYQIMLIEIGLGIGVMNTSTNGYSDLSIKAHDSAISYEESVYAYNGNEYKQKSCLFYKRLDNGRQVREKCK